MKKFGLEEQIEISEPNTKIDMVVGDNAGIAQSRSAGLFELKLKLVKWLC